MTLLEAEIANLDAVLKMMVPQIGRLVLIEVEYARAMRQAELAWVRSFRNELQAGALPWHPPGVVQTGATQPQPEEV